MLHPSDIPHLLLLIPAGLQLFYGLRLLRTSTVLLGAAGGWGLGGFLFLQTSGDPFFILAGSLAGAAAGGGLALSFTKILLGLLFSALGGAGFWFLGDWLLGPIFAVCLSGFGIVLAFGLVWRHFEGVVIAMTAGTGVALTEMAFANLLGMPLLADGIWPLFWLLLFVAAVRVQIPEKNPEAPNPEPAPETVG